MVFFFEEGNKVEVRSDPKSVGAALPVVQGWASEAGDESTMKDESTSSFLRVFRFFVCNSSTGDVELCIALLVPEESKTFAFLVPALFRFFTAERFPVVNLGITNRKYEWNY